MGMNYAEVLGDLDAHIGERKALDMAAVVTQRPSRSKVRRVVAALVLVPVLVAVAFIWAPIIEKAGAMPAVYALGPLGNEQGLETCLRGLWRVRQRLDHYRFEHAGALPPNLAALGAAPVTHCPATGHPWEYTRGEDGAYRIACPQPGVFSCQAVFLDHRFGPPQIHRQGTPGSREEQ